MACKSIVFVGNEEDDEDLGQIFKCLERNGHRGSRVHPRDFVFLCEDGRIQVSVAGQAFNADLVVGWIFEDWLAPGGAILEALALAGYEVVNCASVLSRGQNKALMSARLHARQVPHGTVFWSYDPNDTRDRFTELSRPFVVKPGLVNSGGRTVRSSGYGVCRISSAEGLEALHETLANLGQPLYMQSYVERPECRDIRIWLLGFEPIAACYKIPRGGNWITNTHYGIDLKVCELTAPLVELGKRAAQAIEAEIAGVDIAETMNGDLVVLEVNTCPTFGPAGQLFGDRIPQAYADFFAKRSGTDRCA